MRSAAWQRVPLPLVTAVQQQLLVSGAGRWRALPRGSKFALQTYLSRRECAWLENHVPTRHGLVTLMFQGSGLIVTLTQSTEVNPPRRTTLVSLSMPLISLWNTHIAVSCDDTELFVMSTAVYCYVVAVYRLPDGALLRTWHQSDYLPSRCLCTTPRRTIFGIHADGNTLTAFDFDGHLVQHIAVTQGLFVTLRSCGDLVFVVKKNMPYACLVAFRAVDGASIGVWTLPIDAVDCFRLVFTKANEVAVYVDHTAYLLKLNSGWVQHVA